MIWIFVNLPPQESTSYCGIETNGVVLLEEELVRLQSLYAALCTRTAGTLTVVNLYEICIVSCHYCILAQNRCYCILSMEAIYVHFD